MYGNTSTKQNLAVANILSRTSETSFATGMNKIDHQTFTLDHLHLHPVECNLMVARSLSTPTLVQVPSI